MVAKSIASAVAFSALFLMHVLAQTSRWVGKTVILARAEIELETPDTGDGRGRLVPANSRTFRVTKDENGHLLVESGNQLGWVSREDVVPAEEAVAYFTEAIRRDPTNSYAHLVRGSLLLNSPDRERNMDAALDDFNKAIEFNPHIAIEAYHERATIAYDQGRYEEALADFDIVLERGPTDGWLYHQRGWTHYRLHSYERALADFDRALTLLPADATRLRAALYRDRGNVALAKGEYDQALTDYSKSIELNPAYEPPWNLRGRTWELKKEYGRAVADYERATSLAGSAPVFSGFHVSLAMLLAACPQANIRDGRRALAAAHRAYELVHGPDEMAAMAASYAEVGQFDSAVDWQTRAIAAIQNMQTDQYHLQVAPFAYPTPSELTREFERRLALYRDKKPFRLPLD